MSNESPGVFHQLPNALPGLTLIIVTMVMLRLWIEPWKIHTKALVMESHSPTLFVSTIFCSACGLLYPSYLAGKHLKFSSPISNIILQNQANSYKQSSACRKSCNRFHGLDNMQ